MRESVMADDIAAQRAALPLRVGLIPAMGGGVNATGSYVADFVRTAEGHGFDSVWLGEHPALPVHQNQAYPGSREGLRGPSLEPLPDPIEWLSFAAAHSTTLLLGTAILLLPLHNPVVLAKRIATLDQLSGGRFKLGVGIGWNRQEYEACGVDWARRGVRTDEYIGALRSLWQNDEASFRASTVQFEPVYSSPKPVNGTVPILVGSQSIPGARRAGRLGDGFLPFDRDRDMLSTHITAMKHAAEDAGRDPETIEITALGGTSRDRIKTLIDLGVSRMLMFSADVGGLAALGERVHNTIADLA